MAAETRQDLLDQIRDLQERLDEAEETLRALRSGEVDAVVASGPDGDRVYTLQGADEGYRVMVETMAEGALAVSRDGLILFSNEQFASLLGVPLKRAIGSSISDFIAGEDTSMLAALLAGSGAKAEVRLKKRTDELVPALLSANKLLFDGAECICLIVTDLTDQKRSQEIVAAERLARSILDQAAGAILVVDPSGRIVRASRATEELATGTVLLRKFDDVFRLRADSGTDSGTDSGGKDYTLEEILSMVRDRGSVAGLKATARTLDGRALDVLLSASLLTGANSECLGSIVLLSDVSGLKRAEEAVRQLSEQRGLAMEAGKLGAWDYRFDTGDVFWDERCRNMFGFPAGGQIEYDAAVARIHPDDREATNEAVKQALAGAHGGAYHREFRVVWPDGSVHWVGSHGQVFFEDRGPHRALRFVGVNLDITERKHAEERLWQAQKLESIGVLAGGVAHDFNNILTVIMGGASSAMEECPSCEHFRTILSASERAGYLTKQLLAYAGKAQHVVKTVELNAIVSQSTGLLSASVPKKVNVRIDLSKDIPCIEADPGQIEQILLNLVINAGEAIVPQHDGQIGISTGTCQVTPEMARRHSTAYDVSPGAYVYLEVRDNGAGMDQATVSRIFDPFFSTKFTGRGLGLAAVQGIVRTAKGFIDVRSSPGAGTAMRVLLPASRKKLLQERAPSAGLPQNRGSTVLVVDDEPMVRKLAAMGLRRFGYEVLEAEHGKHALEVLANSSVLPSLALLDLAMPVMGGDELVPILREKYPAVRIIVSSGYPEEHACRSFASGAVAGFLQKPYTLAALAAKVGEALAEGRES
jgi:PAS domain S-box-containing protein